MNIARLTLVALVVALLLPVAASARTHHARWHDMTLTEKRAVVQHEIHVNRTAVQWWLMHRARFPSSASSAFVYCRAVGIHAPGEICLHAQALVKALRVRTRIDAKLAAIAQARLVSAYPPHHALWTCIGRYEGGATSVNPNGHYGMLQMTWNWFGYIKGAASNYPQSVQEWAAERAYANNHYSSSFLYGQWFNYDHAAGECLQYG